MINKIAASCLLIISFVGFSCGQIITTDPVFPSACDVITITYDATEGNGDLTGYVPIYAHTGVITNLSGPGEWRYVQGEWGTADASVIMNPLGNNLHEITISIPSFYGVDTTMETVEQLAFVFRTADGTVVGREADGSDIFVDIYPCSQAFLATLLEPAQNSVLVDLNDQIDILGTANQSATLTLTDNGSQIAQVTGTSISHTLTAITPGDHTVIFTADNGSSVITDSFSYTVNPMVTVQDPPAGSENGITYLTDTSVRLQFWAPNKDHAYVIGDFNNWTPSSAYFMKRGTDGATWWIEITGLNPGEEYGFQYLVDGDIRVGEPYCEKILDPWHDGGIDDSVYPGLKPYPGGLTTGTVSVLETGQTPYPWQIQNFQKPEKTDLVIYEVLMRDFISAHDWDNFPDTLDYFERLGVNAIQFMPVTEFDGNNSRGYLPNYHLAIDKYYGPRDQFRALIDECHARGIAVILDVVFNHVWGESPLAKLYWNSSGSRPTPDNPWLNEYPKHGFNVGNDVNHDSQATRDFMDKILKHLMEDYKIDGFRFDLSKGFTQNQTCDNTGGNCNIGAWGSYDASRVFNLKRMADEMWAIDPDAYVILEHFAENGEETELANYGMMVWGNGNAPYNEATMGYGGSDFSWAVDYTLRGWNDPHLIGYMESHDEERLMYKNLQFGNSSGGYNITDLSTALDRLELAGAFFFTIPGPKMIWKFSELGYDYSLWTCPNGTVAEGDDGCKLSPKPIRWDYNTDPDRLDLYNMWRDLIYLKKNYEVFKTTNFSVDLSPSANKRVHLNHPSMNVTVVGNFNVIDNSNLIANFQHTGWWYEYFTQDSIFVSDVNMGLNFGPGEYRLYSDIRIDPPDMTTGIFTIHSNYDFEMEINPNPTSGRTAINFDTRESGDVIIELFDGLGAKVAQYGIGNIPAGKHEKVIDLNSFGGVKTAYYFVRISQNGNSQSKKLLLF